MESLIQQDEKLTEVEKEMTAAVLQKTWSYWNPLTWYWKPTSIDHLEHFEKYMLHKIKNYKQTLVSIGDAKINTIVVGSGPPLVLLHGFGAGIGFWCKNLDALAQYNTVYAIDLPGFGRSSRTPFKGKSPQEAEEFFLSAIEKWRKEMQLNESFTLLGHSFGGFLSCLYTLKHPDQVNHLILADPWGVPKKPDDWENKLSPTFKMFKALFSMVNPLGIVRAAGPYGPSLIARVRGDIAEKFSDLYEDTGVVSNYIYHLNAQEPSGETAFFTLTQTMVFAATPLEARELEKRLRPDLPVTLIYGEHTWMDKRAGSELKSKLGDRAQMYSMRDCGHHIYADDHHTFNLLVLQSILKQRQKHVNK